MDNFLFFLHILAWPVAILGTLIGGFVLWMGLKYPGSIDETIDNLKGYRRTFHPWKFLIPAFIAWAFIIAF